MKPEIKAIADGLSETQKYRLVNVVFNVWDEDAKGLLDKKLLFWAKPQHLKLELTPLGQQVREYLKGNSHE